MVELAKYWEIIAYIMSMCGALLLMYVKLRHEMEFIKGQLTQLMEFRTEIKELNAQIIDITQKTMKNEYDLRNSFDKIRRLEDECARTTAS